MMDNPKILVIDGDPKNLQILKESLEGASFEVTVTGNGDEAWNIIQTQKPDIIVSEVDIPAVNGFQLLERLQQDPLHASIPLVFLTNRRNLDDRIKSLSIGVKDYMVKPLHVKEVIARLQMILRRIERVRSEEAETTRKVVGRLEENSVESLVENYGVEKRTGVLSLYDRHNRNGEIYFRKGSVVNARLGNFKAEKAVYQMLPWDRGHFIMTFKDVNIHDEITVSNLGLLLQGFKRLQERERLLKQLPSLDTVFVKTSIFQRVLKRKAIGADALKFISLFDGKRPLSQIMSDSTYDDLKTLERIVKLYQQGFVRPPGGDGKLEPDFRRFTPEPSTPAPPVESKHQRRPEPRPEPEQLSAPDFTIYRDQDQAKVSWPGTEQETNNPGRSGIEPQKEPPVADQAFNSQEQVPSPPMGMNAEPPHIPVTHPVPQEPFAESNERPIEPFSTSPGPTPGREEPAVNGHAHTPGASVESTGPDPTLSNDIPSVCDGLFNGRKSARGNLLVISSNNWMRKEFISTLTSGAFSTKAIRPGNNTIEIGKVETSGKRVVEVLGLSTERKFLQMVEQVSSNVLAYVFLVVGENSARLRYFGYLINSFRGKMNAPFVVAVYHPEDRRRVPLDVIRYSLNLGENEQIVDVDVTAPDSVKYLLSQLQAPNYQTNSAVGPTRRAAS
ncbi:MAG: response regulator [bacterium]